MRPVSRFCLLEDRLVVALTQLINHHLRKPDGRTSDVKDFIMEDKNEVQRMDSEGNKAAGE